MAQLCDFCGRGEARYLAKIEGAEAPACDKCARMGEVVEEISRKKPAEVRKIEREKKQRVERVEEVVEDIGEQVRTKREELGLKQEDLAKRIAESESLIKRIEHGFIPSIKTARKLERALKLNLTEYITASDQQYEAKSPGGAVTLGDIMIIKKSK